MRPNRSNRIAMEGHDNGYCTGCFPGGTGRSWTRSDDNIHVETRQFSRKLSWRRKFPSAYRYSIVMFFPSTYPSSRRPCRNAPMRNAMAAEEAPARYPMRGIFPGCCAWAIPATAISITTTRIDSAAAFFILYLVREFISTNTETKKRGCLQRKGNRICRGEIRLIGP